MGGLASSFIDKKGFTWDIGGHILFSHYNYFDILLNKLFKKSEWNYHSRQAWIWIKYSLVPYPFQNNIKYLNKKDILLCLNGLINASKRKSKQIENFRDWIISNFGEGVAKLFLLPYNYKVWGYPPRQLSCKWVKERVPLINLEQIIKNIILNRDEVPWGPNIFFRFPLVGGTGEIWKRLKDKLSKNKCFFGSEVIEINTKNKYVKLTNLPTEAYDILINTIPLSHFTNISDLNIKDIKEVEKLKFSSVHIFGIGLSNKLSRILKNKSWLYFPENRYPFYRATIFSNYSKYNVPDIKKYWSIMLEVSESQLRKIDISKIKEKIIRNLQYLKFINSEKDIIDYWYHFEQYGYPTPTLGRDIILRVLKKLEKKSVFSRGRFGAWKYEVGNQDHAFMQGVELVNRLLLNKKESTVWYPNIVNKIKN